VAYKVLLIAVAATSGLAIELADELKTVVAVSSEIAESNSLFSLLLIKKQSDEVVPEE